MRGNLVGLGSVTALLAAAVACGPTPVVVGMAKDAGAGASSSGGGSSGVAGSSGSGAASSGGGSQGGSSGRVESSSRGGGSSAGSGASSRTSSSGNTQSSSGTRSSSAPGSSSGGAAFCHELDEDHCLQFPQCDVQPGCCPGDPNICVPLGEFVGCPDFCPPPSCGGLNEDQCRHTPGCTADYCFMCSCDGVYQGCRGTQDAPLPCPALGCPQPLCSCNSLDERGCLAAGTQCFAQYCQLCSPGLTFTSCYEPNQEPTCPVVDCAQSCRTAQDCGPAGNGCVAPDDPPTCGACYLPPSSCLSDPDCAPGDICVQAACACNGEKECRAGCQRPGAAACPEGTVCNDTNGHCESPACTAGSCSWNFVCGASGQCQRRACDSDLDCRGSICVEGHCFDQAGYCGFPVP